MILTSLHSLQVVQIHPEGYKLAMVLAGIVLALIFFIRKPIRNLFTRPCYVKAKLLANHSLEISIYNQSGEIQEIGQPMLHIKSGGKTKKFKPSGTSAGNFPVALFANTSYDFKVDVSRWARPHLPATNATKVWITVEFNKSAVMRSNKLSL